MTTWDASSDLLDALNADGVISVDDTALIHDTHATLGGSLLRVMERVAATESDDLWTRLAAQSGRPLLRTYGEIETLEEACLRPYQAPEPLVSRDLALVTLTLAQRREGETLCLLSPDPFVNLSHAGLRRRADEVSPTGHGSLRCAVVVPQMYRRLMTLTYPVALSGELSLLDRLTVQALLSAEDLGSHLGTEHHLITDRQVSEDDFALCLSQHLNVPLFDHQTGHLDDALLPEHLLHQHQLYPHHVDEDSRALVLLTAQARPPDLTAHLQRLSGRAVTYAIATPTVIRTLLNKRTPAHAHH